MFFIIPPIFKYLWAGYYIFSLDPRIREDDKNTIRYAISPKNPLFKGFFGT